MLRFSQFVRSPVLLSIFPFNNANPYDKPKNVIDAVKLDDEMGWDRVKKIFKRNEYSELSKELQSVINMTVSGIVIGTIIGGLRTTRNTIENFIESNEATRFDNHMQAKQNLNQKVMENFLRKGIKMGGKLGLFCFLFSFVTTCTTAYRGKLRVENYILGASATGFLFRMNMGIRGALIGTALGGTLGAAYGTISFAILSLAGITMDEVLQVQQSWITSRDKMMEEKIRKGMAREKPEIQQLFEENQQLKMIQSYKNENVEDSKT